MLKKINIFLSIEFFYFIFYSFTFWILPYILASIFFGLYIFFCVYLHSLTNPTNVNAESKLKGDDLCAALGINSISLGPTVQAGADRRHTQYIATVDSGQCLVNVQIGLHQLRSSCCCCCCSRFSCCCCCCGFCCHTAVDKWNMSTNLT